MCFNGTVWSQDVTFWKGVIDDKIDSIMNNIETWKLVSLSIWSKTLSCSGFSKAN